MSENLFRTPTTRRAVLASGLAAVVAGAASPQASALAAGIGPRKPGVLPAGVDRATLLRWAEDTWRSMVAMTPAATGLPADNITGDLKTLSGYTSPTNIGGYLWSAVVARELRIITPGEAQRRVQRTLRTLLTMEHHEPSGMYYNWYDEATGEALRSWPVTGTTVHPFVSSVDNAWLATGLLVAARADGAVADEANAIRANMDFGFYYNEAEGIRMNPADASEPVGGQIRGGFWVTPPPGCSIPGNYRGGATVYYTCHHYGAFNTEPRMASYLGIAADQIPQKHYFGPVRTFPPTCDWSWTETRPIGEWKQYLGINVFEGALPYRGMRVVPTWGGSMFEALMVPLFVPEEKWGPESWGVNHPLYVQAQIEHGKEEADYGYWGFSPSNNPAGGYREYGVDMLGMDGAGYTSDQERTDWDQPYEGCPGREGEPAPTQYGDGVVTPHASFLALRYARGPALANLAKLRRNFDAYGPGGFYDAIAVTSGTISKRYLSLDQGMIMAALGNALTGDNLRTYVSSGAMAERLRPLMQMEVFESEGR